MQTVGTPNHCLLSSNFFLSQVVGTLTPSITYVLLPSLPLAPCLAPLAPCFTPSLPILLPSLTVSLPYSLSHSLTPCLTPSPLSCSLSHSLSNFPCPCLTPLTPLPLSCSPHSPSPLSHFPLPLAPTEEVVTLKPSITYPSPLPPHQSYKGTWLAPSPKL